MASLQETEIAYAYKQVRDDKDPIDWLLLEYESDKSDLIKLASAGQGGLEEIKGLLKDDQVAYGYIRMQVGNDDLSHRSKFVLFSWCGPKVKVMRKAKTSVHLANVKKILAVIYHSNPRISQCS